MSYSQFVDAYLINTTDQETGETMQHVCEHGALIGEDGTPWAASPGFSLDTYDAVVDQGDGTSSSARIDEFAALLEAYKNRGATTRPGGIRLHREKYFPISYIDTENGGLLCLRKRNGGACVAKSNKAYVIGIFSSGLKIRDMNGREVPQHPGATSLACKSLLDLLVISAL